MICMRLVCNDYYASQHGMYAFIKKIIGMKVSFWGSPTSKYGITRMKRALAIARGHCRCFPHQSGLPKQCPFRPGCLTVFSCEGIGEPQTMAMVRMASSANQICCAEKAMAQGHTFLKECMALSPDEMHWAYHFVVVHMPNILKIDSPYPQIVTFQIWKKPACDTQYPWVFL